MRSRYSFLAFQMRVLTYIKGLWLVSVNSNGRDGGSNAGHYGTISCALTLGHIFLAPYALSVWFSSIAQSFWFFETPWTAAHQASLSITNSWSPPKPMSTESVMPSNHLILCRLLLLPSIFPSVMVFSNKLFTSGGQSIGVSASASVLPMNTQDWSPLESTGWISLQSKGLSRVFSNTTVQKHQFFGIQLSL